MDERRCIFLEIRTQIKGKKLHCKKYWYYKATNNCFYHNVCPDYKEDNNGRTTETTTN